MIMKEDGSGYLIYYVAERFVDAILAGDHSELSPADRIQLDKFLALVKTHARGAPGGWNTDLNDHRECPCHVSRTMARCVSVFWFDSGEPTQAWEPLAPLPTFERPQVEEKPPGPEPLESWFPPI